MRALSKHFFMEVVINLLYNNVDKYATINQEGDVISYTNKTKPKARCTINLAEGQRIFEDLYGPIATRFDKTDSYASLQARKDKAARRRAFKGRS